MATSKSIKANRTTLVDGCGTILKDNRLRGGYQLVKRKRVKSATAPATAPAKRRGRPAKAKSVAPVTATAKRRGRKPSTTAKAMKPSVKATTRKASKRGRRKSVKA